MNRQAIRKKTLQVASSTMISRLLGMVREVLMANFLGVGAVADAFITAFKIPNSMRKVFAEGALSAALVPTFVSLEKKDDKRAVSSLMTLALLIDASAATASKVRRAAPFRATTRCAASRIVSRAMTRFRPI